MFKLVFKVEDINSKSQKGSWYSYGYSDNQFNVYKLRHNGPWTYYDLLFKSKSKTNPKAKEQDQDKGPHKIISDQNDRIFMV